MTLQQGYTVLCMLWKQALRIDLIDSCHSVIQKLWCVFNPIKIGWRTDVEIIVVKSQLNQLLHFQYQNT